MAKAQLSDYDKSLDGTDVNTLIRNYLQLPGGDNKEAHYRAIGRRMTSEIGFLKAVTDKRTAIDDADVGAILQSYHGDFDAISDDFVVHLVEDNDPKHGRPMTREEVKESVYNTVAALQKFRRLGRHILNMNLPELSYLKGRMEKAVEYMSMLSHTDYVDNMVEGMVAGGNDFNSNIIRRKPKASATTQANPASPPSGSQPVPPAAPPAAAPAAAAGRKYPYGPGRSDVIGEKYDDERDHIPDADIDADIVSYERQMQEYKTIAAKNLSENGRKLLEADMEWVKRRLSMSQLSIDEQFDNERKRINASVRANGSNYKARLLDTYHRQLMKYKSINTDNMTEAGRKRVNLYINKLAGDIDSMYDAMIDDEIRAARARVDSADTAEPLIRAGRISDAIENVDATLDQWAGVMSEEKRESTVDYRSNLRVSRNAAIFDGELSEFSPRVATVSAMCPGKDKVVAAVDIVKGFDRLYQRARELNVDGNRERALLYRRAEAETMRILAAGKRPWYKSLI